MTLIAENIIDYFILAIHRLGREINITKSSLIACFLLLAAFTMLDQQSAAQTVSFWLAKSQAYPSPTAPGDLVTYTITYRNTSTNIATNVIITDNLPPNNLFTYASSSNAGVHNSGVQSVVWNIGSVPANGSGFVTVSGYWGRPGASYVPPYNPTSYYTSYGSSTSSITNGASIICDQSPLGFPAPNVSAVVSQYCGSIFPGGANNIKQGVDKVVYYPMTILNTGNIYDNFTLTVPLSVLSGDNTSILYLRILDINKNVIPLSQSGWIPPGGSFSFLLEIDGRQAPKPKDNDIFVISVTATSAVCGTSTSIATVTTTTYNGNPQNHQDISVIKTASAGPYTIGAPITYTIIISNIGQSDATGVVLRDYLPANTPAPININPPPLNIIGNTITWPQVAIDAGETLTPYTLTLTPGCISLPTLVNTAVASVSNDLYPSNNTSTSTISVNNTSIIPVLSTPTPLICSNSNANITASGGSVTQTYRWYLTATGGSNFREGNTYSPLLITSTTFYVSIYDPITHCESNRSSITIVVGPAPAAAGAITGATSICSGQVTINYSVPLINNATSYIWTYTGSGATITGSANSINIDFSPAATSGILTVSGRSFCGDGTSSHVDITITPLPSTSAIYHP